MNIMGSMRWQHPAVRTLFIATGILVRIEGKMDRQFLNLSEIWDWDRSLPSSRAMTLNNLLKLHWSGLKGNILMSWNGLVWAQTSSLLRICDMIWRFLYTNTTHLTWRSWSSFAMKYGKVHCFSAQLQRYVPESAFGGQAPPRIVQYYHLLALFNSYVDPWLFAVLPGPHLGKCKC